MDSLLRDLYSHQSWADAEHWHAIENHPPARDDHSIRNRLHHLHLVQRLFIWAVGDRTTTFPSSKPEDFRTFEQLKAFARESHLMIDEFLSHVTDARLSQHVTFPWFGDPPLSITVSEALTQCVMHSQWHRGQNATRLREVGAEPPTVDLIVWFWKGRPPAQWR
jgi:uncharacterized damage-inducible protein DinB